MRCPKLCSAAFWIVSCFFALSAYPEDTLVLVQVTVTDPLNRFVTGLEQSHFRLYENGVARPIRYFGQKSVPLTMAIVCEVTGGYADIYKQCRYGVRRYVESANPADEFVLVAFDKKAVMVERASRDNSQVEGIKSLGKIQGLNYLEEAIYAGLNGLKSKSGKKALVLVSTANTGTISEAWDVVNKSWDLTEHPEFQIYSIQDWPELQSSAEKKRGKKSWRKTYVSGIEDTGYYLDLIHDELRNQYVLGYQAEASKPALKNRRCTVEIDRPRGLPELKVNASRGYYSPQP